MLYLHNISFILALYLHILMYLQATQYLVYLVYRLLVFPLKAITSPLLGLDSETNFIDVKGMLIRCCHFIH